MKEHDVVIIGGGPAGLFAAITAAGRGRDVLLLEKKSAAGRKLLLSGAGQCNITHDGDIRDFARRFGDNGRFLKPALMNFTNEDLLGFFSARRMRLLLNKHGKFFPDSLESEDVLRVLLKECKKVGALIRYSEPVKKVAKAGGGGFTVTTGKGEYQCRALIIATGGKSYPGTGSTGDGYAFTRALGHTVVTPEPALTPIHIRGNPLEDLARIAFTDMVISHYRAGKKLRQMRGHLILARLGLSGPVVFNMSRYVRPGDEVRLSFVDPDGKEKFRDDFMEKLAAGGNRSVKNILTDFDVPERVIVRVMELSGVPPDTKGGALKKKDRNRLVESLCGLPLVVKDLGDWGIAMVTKGGVALGEVNAKTMESKLTKGLYFAGEVLDIDGDTGGYNIQAAFSTGRLAGKGGLH